MWLRNRLLLFWWAENRENYSVCSLVAEYLNVCCGLTQESQLCYAMLLSGIPLVFLSKYIGTS